jgi:signal transduction histidine kinase
MIVIFGVLSCKQESIENFSIEIDLLRKHKFDSLIIDDTSLDENIKYLLTWQANFIKNFDVTKVSEEELQNNYNEKNLGSLGYFLSQINRGDYLYYKYCDRNIDAKKEYIKALEIASQQSNKQLICEAIKRILDVDRYSYLMTDLSPEYYLDIYEENAYDDLERMYLTFYQMSLAFKNIHTNIWSSEKEKLLLEYANKSDFYLLNGKIFQLIGSYYHRQEDNSKAIYYLERAIDNIDKIKYGSGDIVKNIALISLTRYHLSINDKEKAQEYYSKINITNKNKLVRSYRSYKFYYGYELDLLNNDTISALKNLEYYLSAIEKQKLCKNNNLTTAVEAKFQSKETGRLLKLEKQRNQQIIIGVTIVILFTWCLGYLTITNAKRKRLLALQEKEIETQKNLTLLKEQEISTINAMVEGQEKERKRVAEDLHDNLGSVIATLKLHFENLRMNRERKKIDQEQLFDKTENLIDEAYQKVRSIAHAKNAGVIANQGLLVAVKLMAEKVSSANTIQIDVIDYGLENPLENSLEIALFRIIQELTTNIIKHAKANHATINISLDEEDITILIEDNGIGMNASQIDIQKGMGLHSIKTRVEHLDGTFTIDSTPTKGTTIIINIPT